MHISEPIWGPVILDAMTSSNSANSEANMSSPAGFSSAETDAIVAAISSSGSYLWSFKMYWIIAAPITLATILLPLVAGPIFRRSVIYLYQNRYYARPILALLGLGGIVAMDQFAPVIPYLYVFGISYGLVALYKLIHASVYGKNQWIWTGFSIVFATSLAMDELVAAFAKVGMTGYLPLIYLFLVWYRFEIRDWLGPRLQRPWSHISQRCRKLQLLQFLQSKRWIWQVSLLCIYYTSAVLIYVNVPYYGALSIFSIPLGILAINRFIRSFVTRVYIIRWTVYTVLYTASLIMDARAAWNSDCEYDHVLYNSGPSGELGSDCGQGLLVFGFTCFVPATYLFGFWIFLDYKNPIYGFVGYWYHRGRQISLQDFYRLWPQYRRKSKLQGDPRFP